MRRCARLCTALSIWTCLQLIAFSTGAAPVKCGEIELRAQDMQVCDEQSSVCNELGALPSEARLHESVLAPSNDKSLASAWGVGAQTESRVVHFVVDQPDQVSIELAGYEKFGLFELTPNQAPRCIWHGVGGMQPLESGNYLLKAVRDPSHFKQGRAGAYIVLRREIGSSRIDQD